MVRNGSGDKFTQQLSRLMVVSRLGSKEAVSGNDEKENNQLVDD